MSASISLIVNTLEPFAKFEMQVGEDMKFHGSVSYWRAESSHTDTLNR